MACFAGELDAFGDCRTCGAAQGESCRRARPKIRIDLGSFEPAPEPFNCLICGRPQQQLWAGDDRRVCWECERQHSGNPGLSYQGVTFAERDQVLLVGMLARALGKEAKARHALA